MTQEHPITPPPELVEQWMQDHATRYDLARHAAQWGVDQELKACCEWFQEFYKTESWVKHDLKHFRDARRPKPPSLKEQALLVLDDANLDAAHHNILLRALEQLDD
jgi:hypothetical protein